MTRACERLLRYVTFYTTSDPSSGTIPSTSRQFDLASALAEEMILMGLKDVRADEHCYVYGWLPATPGYEDQTALGFIAHLDTAPDFPGEHVCPQVISDYDGREVKLGGSGRVLSPELFPELPSLAGCTLITTDGQTLLGADDKAGVAEIMTMAEQLIEGKIPHGKICICFTPDEEIGSGAGLLDLDLFGAQYAFTVDGGAENEIEYENFNAAAAEFTIQGRSVHPGEAKGKMLNASLLACEINSMLPGTQIPALTEGYEGFFHLCRMSGDVDAASLSYIVRDHDAASFETRLQTLRHIEKTMNEKYGEGTATLKITQQYRNMAEKIAPCMHLIDTAKEAVRKAGKEPAVLPVRGGTDGAQLSYRGLPCPNLGTGGYAFHGPYEHITAEGMDFVVEVLLQIVRHYAELPRC